jgi:hypothetical protein
LLLVLDPGSGIRDKHPGFATLVGSIYNKRTVQSCNCADIFKNLKIPSVTLFRGIKRALYRVQTAHKNLSKAAHEIFTVFFFIK